MTLEFTPVKNQRFDIGRTREYLKEDIEHLNLNINWGVLTEEEQISLHQLLSKAHQGYCDYVKSDVITP